MSSNIKSVVLQAIIFLVLFTFGPVFSIHAMSWHTEYVESPHDVGESSSLAIDENGRIYIAYSCDNHLCLAYKDEGNWQIETVDSSPEVGRYASLALDSSGNPHIAYYDDNLGNLKYAHYDGSSWQIETVDSSPEVGRYASLALDVSGNPHIAYYDDNLGNLKYAHYDGSSWQIETVDSSPEVGRYASLALDVSGHPHIAYYDDNLENLKYAHYDGTSWQIERVDSSFEVGTYASLALDGSGNPHIAYYDDNLNNLKYAHYDGTSWQIETVDSEIYYGMDATLALDSSGNPHIVYFDRHNHVLKYASYDADNWVIRIISDSGSSYRYFRGPSLFIDSSDTPHVSFYSDKNSSLEYSFYNEGNWNTDIVDHSIFVGEYSSLSLDSSGKPHIAYYDNRLKNLKYAYREGDSWHIETVDSSPEVGEYASLALDSLDNPHIAYLDDQYYHARYAYYDGSNWHIFTVGGSFTGEYTSLALDSKGNPHITYEGFDGLEYIYFDTAWWNRTDFPVSGEYASLALDPSDRPHITTYTSSGFTHLFFDGSSWQTEVFDNTTNVAYEGQISIAVDSSGNPHIAYYYYDASQKKRFLKYAHYDSAGWHLEIVDGPDVGLSPSIALDSTGNPHIAYYDRQHECIKYAYHDATGWHTEIVDLVPKDYWWSTSDSRMISLALDESGMPHISYFDSKNKTLRYSYGTPGNDNYNLVIQVTGTGSGTVTVMPPEVTCESDCTLNFTGRTFVSLEATADEDSVFFGWDGDCSECDSEECNIFLTSDANCAALFYQNGPPIIDNFTAEPTSGSGPLTVTFNCSAYDDDEGDEVSQLIVDFGDGNDRSVRNWTQTVTHTYQEPGTFEAHCEAYDAWGHETTSEPIQIIVTNTPRIELLTSRFIEDFSQGIPEDWQIVNDGTGDTWTTNTNDPCEREPDSNIFESPWVIIDSDCAGDEGYQDDALISPNINIEQYNDVPVFLTFSNYFYQYSNEIADVDISVDNGNTWSTVLTMSGVSVGPNIEQIELSQFISGASELRLRFHYYDASYDWYWILDNISLEARANRLDFGSVSVGTSSDPTIVKIANVGLGTLEIQSLGINGGASDDYAIMNSTCPQETPFTLDSGEFCLIAIQFSPTASGQRNAYLEVFSNDEEHSITSIDLIGLGQPNENIPPEITEFNANPIDGLAPLNVEFTCQANDPDGTIAVYSWDFDGDGVVDETSEAPTITHTYTDPGTYQATCTVTDNDGNSVTSEPREITVSEATPGWVDITETLDITYSARQLYDRIHRCFFIQVTVENPGDAISGPIRLVITDPSIPVETGVGVGLEPDGYTEEGNPYFTIVPEEGAIDPGEVLRNLRINFELQRKRLTYGIKVERLTAE